MSSQPEQIPLLVPGPPESWIREDSSQSTRTSPPLEVSAPLPPSGRRTRPPHERAAIHRELAASFVADHRHNLAVVYNITIFTAGGERTLTGQILMDSITDPVMLARAPTAARDMLNTQLMNPLLRVLDTTILAANEPTPAAPESTALVKADTQAPVRSGDTFEVVDAEPEGQ